jgi:aldose 1-epimerase
MAGTREPASTVVLEGVGARLTVDVAAGGRLASLVVGGRERLLVPHSPADRGIRWGSFLMAPWPGRIAGARLEWDGSSHLLNANDGPNAIHGLVFDRPWRVTTADLGSLSLEVALGPLGWPFGGVVRQRIRLATASLELTAEVVADRMSMPAGLGWHPWFRRPDEGDMTVRVEGADVLEMQPDLIPTGRLVPVRGDTDLRTGPALGVRRLDHVYPAVRSPVVVTWPDLVLTMMSSPAIGTFVVHTPPTGVCVEPQTEWPDAIALAARGVTGTGLVRLGPGETLMARTTWSWDAKT